jgi:hypothetical protein
VELLALPGRRVDSPVVHPGTHHLDLADTGGDRARWGVAVAAHQPVAVLVDQLGEGGQVGVDLGLQRHRQHPPGALAGQLVQAHHKLTPGSIVCDYTQHRGVPSSPAVARRRPSNRSGWQVRRVLMPGAHPQISTISPEPFSLRHRLLSNHRTSKHNTAAPTVPAGGRRASRG